MAEKKIKVTLDLSEAEAQFKALAAKFASGLTLGGTGAGQMPTGPTPGGNTVASTASAPIGNLPSGPSAPHPASAASATHWAGGAMPSWAMGGGYSANPTILGPNGNPYNSAGGASVGSTAFPMAYVASTMSQTASMAGASPNPFYGVGQSNSMFPPAMPYTPGQQWQVNSGMPLAQRIGAQARMFQTPLAVAGIAGAYAFADYSSAQASNIMTGKPTTGLGLHMGIEALGTGLGAAIGMAGGPFGTIAGAHIGHMLASSVSDWVTAPMIREQQTKEMMFQMRGTLALSTARTAYLGKWSEGLAKTLSDQGNTFSAGAAATMLNQGAFGLLAGGINPEQMVKGGVDFEYSNPAREKYARMARAEFDEANRLNSQGMGQYSGNPGSFSNGQISAMPQIQAFGNMRMGNEYLKMAINSKGMTSEKSSENESLSQMITRRIARLYPQEDAALSVMNTVSKVYANNPETGGNIADIIQHFGPAATYQYEQTLTEPKQRTRSLDFMGRHMTFTGSYYSEPKYDAAYLGSLSGEIRTSEREERIGGMQTRGSGALIESAARKRMALYGQLEGGSDSESYAQARSTARSAGEVRFQQESLPYFMAESDLSAERDIANAGPFMPGNRYAISLKSIGMARSRIGQINAYVSTRQQNGDLSEDEELRMRQQVNQLKVGAYRELGILSEGTENRMPAMTAGRISGASRWDSMQMAALTLWRSGSPVRAFGAINGAQEGAQNDWLDTNARGINVGPQTPNGFGNPQADRLIGAIERLTAAMLQTGRGNGAAIPPAGGGTFGGAGVQAN